MSELLPSAKPNFLGKGLNEINRFPEFNRRMYWVMSSLEKFQKEIQDCKGQRETLLKLIQYIEGLGLFGSIALYRVTEENLFELDYRSEAARQDLIEGFVARQMRNGKFAWALKQNRETLIEIEGGSSLGKQAVLFSLSSAQKTYGMFIGFPLEEQSSVMSLGIRVMSLMVDATVFVLENRQLQHELEQYNRDLQRLVDARTQELVSTNQHLHLSNVHLKKLSESRSEMLGIAAHDLKNPLSGIFGCAQLLELTLEDAADGTSMDYHEALNLVRQVGRSSTHMVQVIDELINSEAIESGQVQITPGTINLSELVEQVVMINHPQASAKAIALRQEMEEAVWVHADPLRIQEAVDNLVSNAIKYSPMGSSVWISVQRIHDQTDGSVKAAVMVRDEGPGLTELDKRKLFGRFQKLSARPTAGESSSGLGLSIFKKLVELHNGEVLVESETGKGSTFGFKLAAIRNRTV